MDRLLCIFGLRRRTQHMESEDANFSQQQNMTDVNRTSTADEAASTPVVTLPLIRDTGSNPSNECTVASTFSPGIDAGVTDESNSSTTVTATTADTEGLTLLDLFKSKNIKLRAWNTRVVLRECKIIIEPCQLKNFESEFVRSRKQNVCKRRKRRRTDSTSSETGAITVDNETSSEEMDDSAFTPETTDDETFVKSGDSDYCPSAGRCRRKVTKVRTRSMKREEYRNKRKRNGTSAEVRRVNPRRIVSSTDDDDDEDSDSNFSISVSSEASPVKTRTRRRGFCSKSPAPAGPSRARRNKGGSSLKLKLRIRQIVRNLYVESGESSGKDDSDFYIHVPPTSPFKNAESDRKMQIDSTIENIQESSLEASLLSPVASVSGSPPMEALEELPDTVTAPTITSRKSAGPDAWETEKTGEDSQQVTMPVSLEADSSVVILSIPEAVPPPAIPGISEPSTRTPALDIIECEGGPRGTRTLPAYGVVESSERRDSSDTGSVVPVSELYSTSVPSTETQPNVDPKSAKEIEDSIPEIIGDIQGKMCPYCWNWVPCFKLEMHGSHLHGRNDLAPFLYICQFCEPPQPFQTMITLIDHIEVRHNKNMSIARNPTPHPSPLQPQRDPGFLRMPNVTLPNVGNHLVGGIAQNSSMIRTHLPGNPQMQSHTISYSPSSNSSSVPIVSQDSSWRRRIQALQESQIILTNICRSQITDSLKLFNYQRSQLTAEMGMAIKNDVKEALKRIFLPSQPSIMEDPVNIDPLIASVRKEVHSIVVRIVLAEKLRNRAIHPYVAPPVSAGQAGLFSVQYPSQPSTTTATPGTSHIGHSPILSAQLSSLFPSPISSRSDGLGQPAIAVAHESPPTVTAAAATAGCSWTQAGIVVGQRALSPIAPAACHLVHAPILSSSVHMSSAAPSTFAPAVAVLEPTVFAQGSSTVTTPVVCCLTETGIVSGRMSPRLTSPTTISPTGRESAVVPAQMLPPPLNASATSELGEAVFHQASCPPISTPVASTSNDRGQFLKISDERSLSGPTTTATGTSAEEPKQTPEVPEDEDFECYCCEECNVDFQTEGEAYEHLIHHHGHNVIQLLLPPTGPP